jgi:hypothetical protein
MTVLRGGGEYGPEHVQAMQRQIAKWAPKGTQFVCLTDTDVPGVECIALAHDWPGWWAKIELFDLASPRGFFYTDLDNVILGKLDELLEVDEFTADIGFSFFRLPPAVDLTFAYRIFRSDPAAHMAEWDPAKRTDHRFGDAAFLRWRVGLEPAQWSKQVRNLVELSVVCPWRLPPMSLLKETRVVLCGGKRWRPWLHHSQVLKDAYWCRS